MGIVVRTNLSALNSCRNLNKNKKNSSTALEKLASGYAINRAADDASGLGITEKMRAQITALDTYDDNAEDGISLIQTAEGAMEEIHSMLNRCVELSERAANGIFTQKERIMIQEEVDQLESEIDRISDTANFNKLLLLKGKTGLTKDSFQRPPEIKSDLPIWAVVDGSALYTGSLSDQYTDGTKILSAAYLDFSSFTPDDIPDSFDKGFYTTCCTCDSHYSFRFTDSINNSVERSGRHLIYNIGIKNAKNGDDIYQKIIEATRQHATDNKGQPNNHYTELQIYTDPNDPSKKQLVISDNRDGVVPDTNEGWGVFGAGYAVDNDFHDNRQFSDSITINVGEDRVGKININLPEISSVSLGISGLSVLDMDMAVDSMDKFRKAIDYVSLNRANLGACQNRLEHTIEDLKITSENLSAAKSRIKDTDMSKEMMIYTQENILSQAAQAMLAQANTQPQSVLSLLQ